MLISDERALAYTHCEVGDVIEHEGTVCMIVSLQTAFAVIDLSDGNSIGAASDLRKLHDGYLSCNDKLLSTELRIKGCKV